MKKFLARSTLFAVFAIVFYLVILFLWGNFAPSMFKPNLNYRIGSYGHMFSRLNEFRRFNHVDILFLGSSHAYRGFDTRIFEENGFVSFNLGSSSQTPIQTKLLLDRYLSRINTKFVIYEVYPATFSNDGIESSLDIIANDRNDYYSLRMALELNHMKTYNTLLYGVIRDIFGLNSLFVEPRIKDNDTYVSGGFVEKKLTFYKPMPLPDKKLIINEEQFNVFEDIVGILREKNVELVLVYAPITSSLYNSYLNNFEFDNRIGKYAVYYNFNEILKLDDTMHFSDSHHLNKNGIKIFNEKLIEILKENFIVPHRCL